MAQKYEVYHEVGWDEYENQPKYKRLTTFKNEKAAINFITDFSNIGKHGNMKLCSYRDGQMRVYNEQAKEWVDVSI